MFSNDTGVGMKGHVLLNSGAVRQHWLNVSSRFCLVLLYDSYHRQSQPMKYLPR